MDRLKGKTTINGYDIYHTDNLKEAKANISSGLLSPSDKEKIYNLSNEKIISTQTEFDSLLSSGSIPANTSIFLKNKGTPYLFNTNTTVYIGSNVRITSDGAIVNRGYANSVFATTYTSSYQISSGTKWNTYFILQSGSFNVGDFLIDNSGRIIGEVAGTNGTTIYLTSPLQNNLSSSNYARSCVRNIYLDGWTFDGQNNVNNGSGSLSRLTNGGFITLNYCVDSTFKVIVRNCGVTGNGGAYYSSSGGSSAFTYTHNNVIANVTDCTASNNGGAIYSCSYSNISNINYCNAGQTGGGVSYSHWCTISNIFGCNSNFGGGAAYSSNCSISYINNCTSATNGGAVYNCHYSNIKHINYCTAGSYGGGVSTCNNSTIININYCTAGNNGGGAAYCDFSDFYGSFNANVGGTYTNLYNCTNSLCWVYNYASSARATLNL